MKRAMRKWAGRWLRPIAPGFVRQAWGAPLYGFRGTKSCFRLEHDSAAGALVFCSDTERVRLLLPKASRESIEYWVNANGKCREEWQALMAESRSHRVLFDAGSFDGTEALLFCAANPANRAVIFEPAATPMSRFEETVRANGLADRIVVRRVAVGDVNEERPMYVGPEHMFEIVEAAGVAGAPAPTRVPFRRLDDEKRELGFAPDLIRMDVDACELDALRGAEQLLDVDRPTVLMEIHHDLLERRGQHVRDICDLLTRHRYSFFSCLNEPLTARQVYDTFDAVTNVVARPD